MPRVEVLTEVPERDPEAVLTEHAPSEMLADEHHDDQLVERTGWALLVNGHQVLPGSRRESHPPAPTDPHVSLSTHTARAVWLEDAAPQYRQCTNSSGFRVRRP